MEITAVRNCLMHQLPTGEQKKIINTKHNVGKHTEQIEIGF